MSRLIRWSLLVFVAILAISECSLRLLGAVDFPLHHVDDEIGYIPSPSQSGEFMNKNAWYVNSLSMSSPEFTPDAHKKDVLLVGDSIVYGGNAYGMHQRVGHYLAESANANVWSVAAGSWALLNQLTYLRRNISVVESIDEIVFILNKGDFGDASKWSCDRNHPRSKPYSATLYVLDKYILQLSDCDITEPSSQKDTRSWERELKEFLRTKVKASTKVTFVLYPTRSEVASSSTADSQIAVHYEALRKVAGDGVDIYELYTDKRWSERYYKDEYHPTPQGNSVLASLIAERLNGKLTSPSLSINNHKSL